MEQPNLYFRKITQTGVWLPNERGWSLEAGYWIGDTAVTALEGNGQDEGYFVEIKMVTGIGER